MGDRTKIEWADATWNPLIGCTRVSAGCRHCYAINVAHRFTSKPGPFHLTTSTDPDTGKADWSGIVNLNRNVLEQPLRWTRPRRVFVNSLSDVFHDNIPDKTIARIWAVMHEANWHTFQVLTKRHARMRSLLNSEDFYGLVVGEVANLRAMDERYADPHLRWPLPNVWLGVSVEDQQWADIRIPALLNTPAAIRWVSAEPLLGPVQLAQGYVDYLDGWDSDHDEQCRRDGYCSGCPVQVDLPATIDWVVAGGESGPSSRPMHPDWARSLRDQCAAATRYGPVPFLFKQWGDWCAAAGPEGMKDGQAVVLQNERMIRVGKRAAGRHLDGQLHDGYPDDRDR
jgi:protein gp37